MIVEIRVSAEDLPEDVAAAVHDPSLAQNERDRTRLEAVALLLAAHGGSRSATRTGPDAWCAWIRLPACGADA